MKEPVTVCITVDTRERCGQNNFTFFHDAIKRLTSGDQAVRGVTYQLKREQLDYGDFLICTSSRVIVVERKTHDDFANSIRSKHRDEQRVALDALRRDAALPTTVVWVLEGALHDGWHAGRQSGTNMPNSALDSAIDSLQFKDGFSVHHTANPEHTAHYIAVTLPKRLSRGESGFTVDDAQKSMVNVVSGTKKAVLRSNENAVVYECMLSCVPGLTAGVAAAIRKEYPSMKALVAAYEDCVHTQGRPEKLLAQMEVAGRSKKIGPATSKRLYDALFTETEEGTTTNVLAAKPKKSKVHGGGLGRNKRQGAAGNLYEVEHDD